MWSYYLRVRKVGVRGLKSGHSIEERMKGRRMKERWQKVLLLSRRIRKQCWGSNRNHERIILGTRGPLEWWWWFSHKVVSNSLQPQVLQHTRFPCPPPSPRVCSSSCALSRWCYLTISSSATPLLLPSVFPSIRIFFQWVSSSHWVTKSIGASVSASVLPVNIQNWFPLVLTGLISLKIFAYMKEKNM